MKSKDKGIKLFILAALIITIILPAPAESFVKDKPPEELSVAEVTAEYREQAPLYDVPLSAEIQRYIFNVSDYYDIEPSLIIAVIEHESGYNSATIGDGGESIGLM